MYQVMYHDVIELRVACGNATCFEVTWRNVRGLEMTYLNVIYVYNEEFVVRVTPGSRFPRRVISGRKSKSVILRI